MDEKKVSKFLSLVLRHKPEEIGIQLDTNGWTDVKILLQKLQSHGMNVNMTLLRSVVANNDKKRFSFNEHETEIRANQGHSTDEVNLEFEKQTPLDTLYHGTSTKFINQILKSNGLEKIKRHHVHMSSDFDTANKVGARHGKQVIIIHIDAKKMFEDGFDFFLSANGVWLTNDVPKKYFKNLEYL